MTSDTNYYLSGEVYYLPKIALPSGCTLTVELADIALQDIPARVIATSTTQITHQVPLPFLLKYSPSQIPEYADHITLGARIEFEGRLLWRSAKAYPFELGNCDQTDLQIKLVQAVNEATDDFQGNNGISGGFQGNNGVTGGIQGDNGFSGGIQGDNGFSGGFQGGNGVTGGTQGNNGTDHN